MKTTVIICTFNRSAILHDTIFSLMKQTVLPASIIVSLCDENSTLAETRALPLVRCVYGPRGSSAQRNTAIPYATTPFVLFLDDDVELAPDYIEQMESAFTYDPAVVAASGKIVADGAHSGKGIDRDEALAALCRDRGSRACTGIKLLEFYGCNMFVRGAIVQKEKFDERLPLYGWLEDRDFLWRVSKHGKLIRNHAARIAHLATRTGRTSDLRYGYTKIANPYYMWQKSVIAHFPDLFVNYWMKTTLANAARALGPRRANDPDYRERLRGNFLAYRDLLLSRLDPRNILNLPDSSSANNGSRPRNAWQSEASRST
jgi:GT2 family glycosyltransferase